MPETNDDVISDLSKKIKLSNGSTTTFGDLLKQAERAKAANDLETKLNDLTRNLKEAYAPGKQMAEQQAAWKKAMLAAGYSESEVDALLTPPKGKKKEATPLTDDEIDELLNNAEAETDDDDTEVKRLQKQIEELRAGMVNTRQADLQKALTNRIEQFVGGHKLLKGVVSRLEKDEKTKAKAENVGMFVRQQLDRAVKEAVHLRVERGEPFNEAMFEQEIKRVGPGLIDVFQSVIDAHEPMPRVSETVSGFDAVLKKEPMKQPTADPKVSAGELDNSLRDWLTDSLSREAADLEVEEKSTLV